MAKDTGRRRGASRRSTRKTLTLLMVTAVTALFSWWNIARDSLICYAVSYEGESVGQVATRWELMEAVEEADALAGELLGEDHPVARGVAVTTSISRRDDGPEALTANLLYNVEGIEKRWAILVDGEPVGTLGSEEELRSLIYSLISERIGPGAVSAEFEEDVRVEYTFVPADLTSDPEEIARLLSPGSTESPVSLTLVTREREEGEETIPHVTTYEYDDELFEDEERVEREGSDGERKCLYTVLRRNGEEISRELTSWEVTEEPVSEVIVKGTREGSRTDSQGYFIWPTNGIISSYFGYRSTSVGNSNHKGLDIANSVGTNVYAADGGVVTFAGWSGAYGNIVKLTHDDGTVTYYGHLSSILTSEGERVAQGQLIALMGRTGNVSGPHLHFEVRPSGGSPVDPLGYLELSELRGK